MIEICVEEKQTAIGACLKVIGIGGAGGNAVNSMINNAEIEAVNYLVANTDAQALNLSSSSIKIQLGSKITKGLGAGSNPDVGRRSAEEDIETILTHIEDADILFLTAGLGGGTGSGALPVIAKAAKDMGVLTVSIVTKPFVFEGKRRLRIAEDAIKVLKQSVDTLIVVPNQRLLEVADAKISMLDAFALSNDILKQAIKGISDIITKSGHINVDFADVKTIMKDMGMALMGIGRASGENRAREAAEKAISSPLLENISIDGAQGVLINITGGPDLGLYEINEAASMVYDMVSEDANIILGSVIDQNMNDELMVTVIATGFETPDSARADHAKDSIAQEKTDAFFGRMSQAESIKGAVKHEEKKHEEKSAKDQTYDLNDLDTPTFLRKKAEVKQLEDATRNAHKQEEPCEKQKETEDKNQETEEQENNTQENQKKQNKFFESDISL